MKDFTLIPSPYAKQLASEMSMFMRNTARYEGKYLLVYYSNRHETYLWTWYDSITRPLIDYEEAKQLIRRYKSTR
jgi:hypothetical protein